MKCHCLQWAPCRLPYSGCKVAVSSQALLMFCINEAAGGLYFSMLTSTSSLSTSSAHLKSILWLKSKRMRMFFFFSSPALCPKKIHLGWGFAYFLHIQVVSLIFYDSQLSIFRALSVCWTKGTEVTLCSGQL